MNTETHHRRGWASALVTLALALPLAACQTAATDSVVAAAPAQAETGFRPTADQLERDIRSRSIGHSTIPDDPRVSEHRGVLSPTPTPSPGPAPCLLRLTRDGVGSGAAEALCADPRIRLAR